MAITRNNLQTQSTASSSTSYTISSYSVNSGGNRVLIVFAHIRIGATGDFTASATWDGNAMTEAITNTGAGTSRRWRTYIWYYIAPAVTSADIVISTDGTTAVSWVAGAVTLQGAKQSSPVGITGTSTSATAAITFNSVTVGSIILTAHTSDSAGPVDWSFTTSTELYDVNQGDTTAEIGGAAGYYDVTSSGNVTLTATKTGTGQGAISAGAEFVAALSGTADVTLGAVTSSATGVVALKGTASVTLGAVTSSATGTVALKGTADVTLGAVTASATGVVALKGTASVTLGAVTSAATGLLPIAGAASLTLGAITASGALLRFLNAVIAASSDDASQTSSTVNTTSYLATGSNGTWLGVRFLSNIPRYATISVAYLRSYIYNTIYDSPDMYWWGEAVDNAAAYEETNNNISARTKTTPAGVLWQGADVGIGSHNTPSLVEHLQQIINRTGYAAGNYVAFIANGRAGGTTSRLSSYDFLSGGHAPTLYVEYYTSDIYGQTAVTLDAVTNTATGTVAVAGVAAVTLDDVTSAATGDIEGGPIEGLVAVTLDAVTSTATGVIALAGQATVTLGDTTLAATGVLTIAGQATVTLDNTTLSAAGTVAIVGQTAVTLDDVTLSATGQLEVEGSGTLAVTLDAITATVTGVVPLAGVSSVTLDDAALSSAGTIAISAAAGVTLDDASLAATGVVALSGQSSVTLAGVTLTATGAVAVRGTAAITLGAVTLTAAGALDLLAFVMVGSVMSPARNGRVSSPRPVGAVRSVGDIEQSV